MKPLFLLLVALPSYGAVITLTAPGQTAAPGDIVTFSGKIENTALLDEFLNDIVFTFTPPGATYLTPDFNYFFANVPGLLLSGETYMGPIFSFLVAPATPLGLYAGTVSILGGAAFDDLNPFGPVNFSVMAVPEPATAGLLLVGVLALAVRQPSSTTLRRAELPLPDGRGSV